MKRYDAIVVGSGITGGFAAKELTEEGLDTLVLEAGRSIDPAHDYVENVQPWDLRFRDLGDRFALDRAHNRVRGVRVIQTHEIPNLFVTDGACMTSSSCVNPSLTDVATARACDYAVREMDLDRI